MNSTHELMPHALGRSVRSPSLAARALLGLLRLLLVLGIVAGVVLALYRNDVLLSWARRAGKEAEFLRLERQHLGGAPWGTQRSQASLLAMLAQQGSNAGARTDAAPRVSQAPALAVAPDPWVPELKPVSVESLPLAEEPTAEVVAVSPVDAATDIAPAQPALTDRRSAPSATQAWKPPLPQRKARAASSPDVATSPPVKSPPASAAAAAPASSTALKPAARVSATLPVNENVLKAAIRSAVVAEQ